MSRGNLALSDRAYINDPKTDGYVIAPELQRAVKYYPVLGSRGLGWGDRLLQAVCGLDLELFGQNESVTGARE